MLHRVSVVHKAKHLKTLICGVYLYVERVCTLCARCVCLIGRELKAL